MSSPKPKDSSAQEATAHAIRFGGLTTIVRVPSQVSSSVAVLEHIVEPGFLAAPLHIHTHEDEVSHVLEGEITVSQGGEVRTYGPGETVTKPRGVMHTFWNAGDVPLRFLEIVAPGTGFDRYFAELAPFLPEGAPPDLAGVGAVAARYGIEFDMPATFEILQRYGLRM